MKIEDKIYHWMHRNGVEVVFFDSNGFVSAFAHKIYGEGLEAIEVPVSFQNAKKGPMYFLSTDPQKSLVDPPIYRSESKGDQYIYEMATPHILNAVKKMMNKDVPNLLRELRDRNVLDTYLQELLGSVDL